MTSSCPVCGFGLDFLPWDGESPSDEICPSCGIQFGYDDAAGGKPEQRSRIYEDWRSRWVTAGCPWSSARPRPKRWDPRRDLERVRLLRYQKSTR